MIGRAISHYEIIDKPGQGGPEEGRSTNETIPPVIGEIVCRQRISGICGCITRWRAMESLSFS